MAFQYFIAVKFQLDATSDHAKPEGCSLNTLKSMLTGQHATNGGCNGLMYVDRFRLQAKFDESKHNKDSGERCRCSGYYVKHRKGQHKTCIHYEETVIHKAMTKGTFKHSPIKKKDLMANDDECPF